MNSKPLQSENNPQDATGINPPRISIIFGKRGSGKTFLTLRLLKSVKRYIVYDPIREYGSRGEIANNAADVLDLLEAGTSRIVVQSDSDALFPLVSKIVYRQRGLLFVVDEADLFTSAGDMPDDFRKIIRYGRHSGLGILAISRRPAAIPRDLTSQANNVFTFRMHEPRDLQYLGQFFPDTSKIETLDAYQYALYNSDTGEVSVSKVE